MNGVLHSEHVISRSGIAVSPPRVIEDPHSLALRSAGVAFLSTTGRGAKALFFFKRTPKSPGVPTVIGPECTPAVRCIQIFKRTGTGKLWQNVFTSLPSVARVPHIDRKNFGFYMAYLLLGFATEVCIILATRVPTFD